MASATLTRLTSHELLQPSGVADAAVSRSSTRKGGKGSKTSQGKGTKGASASARALQVLDDKDTAQQLMGTRNDVAVSLLCQRPATISQNVLYAVALYKENTRALTFENVPADSLSHRTHAG